MNEWEWQLLEDKKPVEDLHIDGIEVKQGSRVRLRPKPGGDIMDIALAGKSAIVESIEQDYEGKFQLAVVVDDDPNAQDPEGAGTGHMKKNAGDIRIRRRRPVVYYLIIFGAAALLGYFYYHHLNESPSAP